MKEEIKNLIIKYGPLSFDALCNFLNCSNEDLASVINPMEDEEVIKIGKRYFIIDNEKVIRGTLVIKKNHGYVKTDNDSIPLDDSDLSRTFDKDIVICSVESSHLGKMARLVKVVAHGTNEIVAICTKQMMRKCRVFKVKDPNTSYEEILVDEKYLNGAKPNDICLITLYYSKIDVTGRVKSIIAHKNDLGSDILALVASAHVPYEFKNEVLNELDQVNDKVTKDELADRVDYTKDTVITIDGVDSKDFDDAISLVKKDNHYILSVHIADVSHYVKENTALDKEALERGTSIYLVDRVIPMLPEKLSNGICSLNEGVVRLVLSTILEYDEYGNLVDGKITKGYIKSTHRMTYPNVNKILQGDPTLCRKYSDIAGMLASMQNLAHLLRGKRTNRGALDFDVAEIKVEVDEKGYPINIKKRERDEAEMLIEDFMLEANEYVAETLNRLEYPCVYRVHEDPSKEKLMNLSLILKNYGLNLKNIEKGIRPKELQQLMAEIDNDNKSVINSLLLRCMAKARYDSRCLGHYGLAAKYYCHFTSPIRRYSDLETHRILHDIYFNEKPDFNQTLDHFQKTIDEVCLQASLTERKSIDLERMVDDMKMAEYMENKIGNIYSGMITSVTNYGFYVMLDSGVEGLCHIKNLPDYYDYDQKRMALIGNYTKDVYNIGDRVKVRVISSDKEKREIDFSIFSHIKKGK